MKKIVRRLFGFQYDYENRESIILRDFLALERTRLANERTLLSYIRTALYLLLGGFALIQLRDYGNLTWLGYLAIVLSTFFYLVRNLPVLYTQK